MQANDVKKGMKFETFDGFYGEITSNKKGVIRDIKLDGLFGVEYGSIYMDRIHSVLNPATGKYELLEMTEAQSEQLQKIHSMGF